MVQERRPAYEKEYGSERDSDGWGILGCFLDGVNSDEFDVSYGHPLGLQEQVAEILITASAVDQHTNVPVDRFDHAEAHLGPTVIENAVQVLDQHRGEFLKRGQSLPPQLIYPFAQIFDHGPFVAVVPKSFQAFEHPPVQLEQPVQYPALPPHHVLPPPQHQPFLPFDHTPHPSPFPHTPSLPPSAPRAPNTVECQLVSRSPPGHMPRHLERPRALARLPPSLLQALAVGRLARQLRHPLRPYPTPWTLHPVGFNHHCRRVFKTGQV